MVKKFAFAALATYVIGMAEGFGMNEEVAAPFFNKLDKTDRRVARVAGLGMLFFSPLNWASQSTRCPKRKKCGGHGIPSEGSQIFRREICLCHENWEGKCCDKFSYTGECGFDNEHMCSQDKLRTKEMTLTNMVDDDNKYVGRIRPGTDAHGLPKQMQGVFWLKDNGNTSAFMSFAPSRDGDGLSKWADGKFSIRVAGDNVWAFFSRENLHYASGLDLIYDMVANDHMDPTEFQIFPRFQRFPAFDFTSKVGKFMIDLKMTKIESQPADANGAAAVKWKRESKRWGKIIENSEFEVLQIFDGDGNPTSAFSEFQKYYEPRSDLANQPWWDGDFYYSSNDRNFYIKVRDEYEDGGWKALGEKDPKELTSPGWKYAWDYKYWPWHWYNNEIYPEYVTFDEWLNLQNLTDYAFPESLKKKELMELQGFEDYSKYHNEDYNDWIFGGGDDFRGQWDITYEEYVKRPYKSDFLRKLEVMIESTGGEHVHNPDAIESIIESTRKESHNLREWNELARNFNIDYGISMT